MNISKVICGNYSYQLYSFNYFLESMKRLEQKEIELWGAGPHLFQDDFSEQMMHSLYKKIKNYGLRVICYTPEQCMYPINIASSDPIIRKRSIAYLTRSLEIASQMEAPKALITTGQGYRDESKEDAWNRCVEALSILGGKAEQLGVTIVFEHLTKTTTNLCLKARDVDRMLKEVGMIDVDMAARLHEGIRDYFELMGKSIQHVHFVDGNPA
jgi:protein FrlC